MYCISGCGGKKDLKLRGIIIIVKWGRSKSKFDRGNFEEKIRCKLICILTAIKILNK